jgi:hypothetical protein
MLTPPPIKLPIGGDNRLGTEVSNPSEQASPGALRQRRIMDVKTSERLTVVVEDVKNFIL